MLPQEHANLGVPCSTLWGRDSETPAIDVPIFLSVRLASTQESVIQPSKIPQPATDAILRDIPHMAALESSTHLKLDNILVATDLSLASEMALLHAISIAHRHDAKLLVVHVSSSQSEGARMDAWRAVQTKILGHFIAGRLTDLRYELLVKSGDVWTVLSGLIAEHGIDLVVVGTRGRTGVWKLLLGSVAERIFGSLRVPCSPSVRVSQGRIGRVVLSAS
jgi:nucleotide-binding universal stress UspA family protein